MARYITPVTLADGSVLDLDAITYMSAEDKLDTIQAVLDGLDAEDAVRPDNDPGFCLDKIQRILHFLDHPN